MALSLKSELLTVSERRLLLEAMFAGVNHNLLRQVHGMLPSLPMVVPDTELQAVCLALLLAGLNEPLKAGQILAKVDLPEAVALRPFFPTDKREFTDEHHH